LKLQSQSTSDILTTVFSFAHPPSSHKRGAKYHQYNDDYERKKAGDISDKHSVSNSSGYDILHLARYIILPKICHVMYHYMLDEKERSNEEKKVVLDDLKQTRR
jgi:hypothetical protein